METSESLAHETLPRGAGADASEDPSPHSFEALQALGQAAFEEGRVEESIRILEQALIWAEQHGDSRQVDLAFCNLTSARITRGERELLDAATMNRLRGVLLANEDLVNSWLAAYNLARAFEYKKDNKKGLFYARIALDRAELLDRTDWIASSHNQIGNFLLAESFFEQAAREYDNALVLYPPMAELRRGLVLGNLGYCHVASGLLAAGVEMLYRSLRVLRRLGSVQDQAVAHNDLCFTHLELGRYQDAVRHGSRALVLAEKCGSEECLKNTLYLLGTAVHYLGDSQQAEEHFRRLQERFYPESRFVAELLLRVDVRRMINLRAS